MRPSINAVRCAGTFKLTEEPIEAWLTKWGSFAGGLALLVLSVVVLPRHASRQSELTLGLGMAFVACSNLFLFGVLSRRVHLAHHLGLISWGVRRIEFLGLGLGSCIITAAGWFIMTAQLGLAEMLISGLLAVALAFAVISIGLWFTLRKGAQTNRLI